MGQRIGSLRSHRVIRKNGELVLDQHPPPDLIEFSPEQSQLIAYGIDSQTSSKFRHKTLSLIAGYDAKSISETFRKSVSLPASNIKCYVASIAPDSCTFEGIHRSFMEAASRVDTNGIFVFSFSGHGIKVGQNKWGLAPIDFDYTMDTFITAKTLTSWLQYVRFQGRYALFILDCCYAGGIAEQVVIDTIEAEIPIPGLFVFTSCTALESSLVITTLEHSIFNYFFSYCLYNSYYCQIGRLAIKELYQECESCCLALSSLLIAYDSQKKLLKWSMMQPELKYFQLTEFVQSLLAESDEEIDAATPGRFQFALSYYTFQKKGKGKSVIIPDKCQAWLEIASQPNGALTELHERKLLDGKLLVSAAASMIHSMASFFIACDLPNVSASNTFIVAFLHVIAAIDRVHQNVTLTLEDMKICLEYYCNVLDKHRINTAGEMKKLHNTIRRDINRKMRLENCGESTDSGASPAKMPAISSNDEEDIDIPVLAEWIPVDWD